MSAGAQKTIAVLGGGITGLAAAYRLTRFGHRVRLFEAGPRLGGAIRTEISDGWLAEAGPQSLSESAATASLLQELGLGPERVTAQPTAKNRYLVREGRPVAVPLSPPALIRSPLFSFGTKLRILAEAARRPRQRTADLSLADFAREHFGADILTYAVQPIVSGIYAGDPERLSAREAFPRLWAMEAKTGSLLRGQVAAAKLRRQSGRPGADPVISFRDGMQTLPDALAVRLPAGTTMRGTPVARIYRNDGWRIVSNDSVMPEKFDAVISALPGDALARLVIGAESQRPLASLAQIAHPPLSVLFLGYRREQVAHPLDGFGMLVPAIENRRILGVVFSSSLFPNRAPAGHIALTVMVGGVLQPDLANLPTAELIAAVKPDLSDLLGVSGSALFHRHTLWPRAIPQYDLGYEKHKAAITACEAANPGLHIGGQSRDGISLPDCLASGRRLAEAAAL